MKSFNSGFGSRYFSPGVVVVLPVINRLGRKQ